MDRLGEMQAFCAIVRQGSLAGAARAMGLSPSAISKTVSRLEARLGGRLLARSTRALALTAEGTAYHAACLRILAEMEAAERAVAEPDTLQGRIGLNASMAFGNLFILPLIPDFLERHPAVSVEIGLSDSMVDLIGGDVDIAIRVGPLPDSALTARKLGESPRVVVASPAYLDRHGAPRHPEELSAHRCLRFTFRRGGGWLFRDGERLWEVAPPGSAFVDSGETARHLVLGGAGIARLGLFHVARDIAAGRLVPLLEAFNPGDREEAHMLFMGGAGLPRRVRALLEHLAAGVDIAAALAPAGPALASAWKVRPGG
ncbi:MAG: transcriptional regulator, LysR family [Roseomonas sp.]|nr:transcriptional regulator, LysR family [Roseomonas sp.]